MIFCSLILLLHVLASSSSPAMARNRSRNIAIGNDDHNDIDDKQGIVYVQTNVKASKNMGFLNIDNDFLPENSEVSVNGYE